MAGVVILEHTVPDGGSHLDWMVEDADLDGEHRLRTWRVSGRPDRCDQFGAERIGDHRAAYLWFEGDIGGGRGRVTRIAEGNVVRLELTDSDALVGVAWRDGSQSLHRGICVGGDRWEFTRVRGEDST